MKLTAAVWVAAGLGVAAGAVAGFVWAKATCPCHGKG